MSRAVSQVTLAWPRPKASTGCQNLAFLGHDQNHKLGPQTPTHEPRVWHVVGSVAPAVCIGGFGPAPAAADRTPSCAHRGWEQAQPPRTEQRERRSPPRRGRFCAGHWTSWDRCWARDGKASHGALVLAQMSDLHSSCKWLFPEMFRRKLTISIQFKMPLI